ncbi:hypothetical protein Q5424_23500 [Conexibacter sp. JD483]|uniref:hypothetical protein n=1 Tax=unclassified Conexibacter TaxID=2627773 RepID=UPI0027239534|nr:MULTISPECIES: hypothetical protein [unclassified Conexibacter]MDO8185677.1 hypothetical protein [Conexibacter sp. CPCC 205706]MDO8198850.1 hypothetical protein [Conexibacter sp. CPCC 205762]MDR9372083.1 hypothetical protein [Conexibacter sp. JD483]
MTIPLRAALIAALLSAATPAAALAVTRPQVRILGFTTYTRIGIPQVQAKPGRTIRECFTRGDGEREISVVYSGRGIGKGTKVGVAFWGPPGNGWAPDAEPTIPEVMRSAFRWPVPAGRSKTLAWGYLFASGPFGPARIDGSWTAEVVVAGRVLVRKSVTVACDS